MTSIDNANRRLPHAAPPIDPIAGALAPVLASAFAMIRESGSLVCHLAGFGVALLASPAPASRSAADRPRTAVPVRDNVIPFPAAAATRPQSTRIGMKS